MPTNKSFTKPEESFADLFEGKVTKHKPSNKLPPLKSKITYDAGLEYRRSNAQEFLASPPEQQGPIHITSENEVTGSDFVMHHSGGLQHSVLKSLRTGSISINASIDLHGSSSVVSQQQLEKFLNAQLALASSEQKRRCLLVIHGKGSNAKEQNHAVLKSVVCQYLKRFSRVLAFSSAQLRDGGTGALYVLVR